MVNEKLAMKFIRGRRKTCLENNLSVTIMDIAARHNHQYFGLAVTCHEGADAPDLTGTFRGSLIHSPGHVRGSPGQSLQHPFVERATKHSKIYSILHRIYFIRKYIEDIKDIFLSLDCRYITNLRPSTCQCSVPHGIVTCPCNQSNNFLKISLPNKP